jgi:hypothetical protein
LAPATVRRFSAPRASHSHYRYIQSCVHAPAGHFHNHLLDRFVVIFRIDAVGRAEFACQFEFIPDWYPWR